MLDTILHAATLVASSACLGILLREHKIYVRIKDRLNTLWYHYCKTREEPYVPLDNGKQN